MQFYETSNFDCSNRDQVVYISDGTVVNNGKLVDAVKLKPGDKGFKLKDYPISDKFLQKTSPTMQFYETSNFDCSNRDQVVYISDGTVVNNGKLVDAVKLKPGDVLTCDKRYPKKSQVVLLFSVNGREVFKSSHKIKKHEMITPFVLLHGECTCSVFNLGDNIEISNIDFPKLSDINQELAQLIQDDPYIIILEEYVSRLSKYKHVPDFELSYQKLYPDRNIILPIDNIQDARTIFKIIYESSRYYRRVDDIYTISPSLKADFENMESMQSL
eukprot:TRINITY_DN6342_c0_g1_i1.p1 TRINITY_DN6342_c0_g1~~TRINITY_DN6342_c0_g1_i1.p1  ORF type:complete len:301 (-),score=60.48 TRINITY_DN6342_c0_g1_i1:54-869(-)